MHAGFERVISADSHVIEPHDLWVKALGDRYGERTPQIFHEHLGQKGTFFNGIRQILKIDDVFDQEAGPGRQEAGYKPEVRVQFQVDAGIDAELLNPTLTLIMVTGSDKEVVKASTRAYNEWIADFCSYDPKRLIGVGILPLDDIDWALAELTRIRKRGLRGVIIPTQPPEDCPPYRNAFYEQFWAAAEEMGIPVTLHIAAGRIPDAFHLYTREELEEAPRINMMMFYEALWPLVTDFIFGKVLDRHPNLKLVLSEYEISWIPPVLFRLDQMQNAFKKRLPLPELAIDARDYLRHRVYHGVINDPMGPESVPYIGIDQVLWGSDFPHTRSIGLDAHEQLERMFGRLSREDQMKLVAGNVARVYGL